MRHPLVVLFAVMDGQAWSLDQVTAWADQRFMASEGYEDWLAELGRSKSLAEGLEVVREAMIEAGIQLPDDIGDLMAGFVLMNLERGDISEREARAGLIDVADAYGVSGLDAEKAGVVELDAPALLRMKADAERSSKSLTHEEEQLEEV